MAQRYIAKITLAAHLPGNGMGGSTNPGTAITDPATNPQTGYWTSGAWGIWAKKSTPLQQATACGGISTQMPQAPSAATTGAVAGDTSLKMNGGLACSKLTTGAGSAASNTAQVRTVQPEIRQSGSGTGLGTATTQDKPGQQNPPDFGTGGGAKSILPYQVLMTVGENVASGATTATTAGLEGRNGGLTNEQIKKATRGLPQTATLGTDFDKSTPTACIGPSVIFNDVPNSGSANGVVSAAATKLQQGVALCDPFGFAPAQKDANINNAASEVPLPSASATFAKNKEYYSGTGTAAATAGVKLNVQKFWDPITAAQASGGAFCCDALYYGADGLGRGIATNDPPIVAVTKNSAFVPVPLGGGAMEAEVVPGGVCTGEAANNAKMQGLSKAVNVKQKEMLEGQAFYAVLAPSQYVLPKVNSVATTQAANAARQKKCSETITKMLRMNRVDAGVSTSATGTTCANNALAIPGVDTDVCTGTAADAIEYPLWMVGIGGGPTPASYAVPNGYCYANACFENFAAVGTAATFDGATKLSTLQSSPDMSTNPSATTGNSCGRANAACMAPPATWNGGEAVFKVCSKTAGDETSCTLAEKQGQTGMLPTA